jgi:hypothetical protein
MHDHRELPPAGRSDFSDTRKNLNLKERLRNREFIETCTQENNKELQFASQKYNSSFKCEPKFTASKKKK